ncbi:MAG: hypothetical protein AB7S70_16070 [Hyphomicrobium sp.]|uniref:hypothetical protein n=1 Tax=Hyphomicrobium sp. TaxID=82 RepID=UPI003D0D60C5
MQHAAEMSDMAKRIGRPSKPEDEHAVLLSTRWPRPLVERTDAICERRPDQPSRTTVMREALAIGLDALEARLKGRK